MLSIDLGSTSGQFIDWQAVQNALLKGETISVKQSGKKIGQVWPNIAKPINKKCQLGFMIGEGVVPDDIHWGDDEIMAMFEESFDENIE